MDNLIIPWDEGASHAEEEVINNLTNIEEAIQSHAHVPETQEEPIMEESDFSVVDSEQFEFNMNYTYDEGNEVNESLTPPNQVTQTVEPIDEGSDEEEDPNLDMLILDLISRERGETHQDALSVDTNLGVLQKSS